MGPTNMPTAKPVTMSPTNSPTSKPVTMSPTRLPTPDPAAASNPAQDDDPQDIAILYWDDLSSQVRSLYETLGYDRSTWDAGVKLPLDSMAWDDLAFEERFAIVSLGYDPDGWNEVEAGMHFTNQPSSTTAAATTVTAATAAAVAPGGVADVQYWEDISPGIRDVYLKLGYTQASWDAGENVAVDAKGWEDMSFEEKFAVYSLGYDKGGWDGVEAGEHFPSQPDVVLPKATSGPTNQVSLCGGGLMVPGKMRYPEERPSFIYWNRNKYRDRKHARPCID